MKAYLLVSINFLLSILTESVFGLSFSFKTRENCRCIMWKESYYALFRYCNQGKFLSERDRDRDRERAETLSRELHSKCNLKE